MSRCTSCHEVIGIGCFNPKECMEITQDQSEDYSRVSYELSQCQSYISHLEKINEGLENRLRRLEDAIATKYFKASDGQGSVVYYELVDSEDKLVENFSEQDDEIIEAIKNSKSREVG